MVLYMGPVWRWVGPYPPPFKGGLGRVLGLELRYSSAESGVGYAGRRLCTLRRGYAYPLRLDSVGTRRSRGEGTRTSDKPQP